MISGGTLFSGGGGFCLGMVAAGVRHAWGVEYDDKIAQVARDNGLATITADILECGAAFICAAAGGVAEIMSSYWLLCLPAYLIFIFVAGVGIGKVLARMSENYPDI